MSAFEDGIELMAKVRTPEGTLQTAEFLDVCRQILPTVGERYSEEHAFAALSDHSDRLPCIAHHPLLPQF